MTAYSLMTCIYRFKADWSTYLADCLEAEERGERSDLPHTFEPALKVLEAWQRPAESLPEAMAALDLAIADYESGDTPVVPAMMKAALGWMETEYQRRGEQ